MKKIVATGKTVEDAVNNGLYELNVSMKRVNIRVLDQATKGFIGIGTKEARVELELIPDPIEESIQFLNGIFTLTNSKIQVEQDITLDGPVLNLKGSQIGIFIGKKGQTLDALQNIVNLVANQHSTSHVRIVVDAENFRFKRKRILERLATDTASQVIKTNREIKLEPMTASERKVIHYELQDHPVVKTYSVGEEPNRCIVICLK